MSTPESRVKAKVKRALATLPRKYHHMSVMNGMGAPALDFYCCIDGLFIAIETKVEGKKLTPRQLETARHIVTAGGTVYVVRNDVDIVTMMSDLLELEEIYPQIHDTLG